MTITENLPAELRETGLFCVWRREERNGKPTKVPYNPRTGGGAMSNNPATFAPLSVAEAAQGQYDGIGVGIFGDVCAIDIDHCIDEDGAMSETAALVMAAMNSYTEYSPSGTGLRILFKAPGFQYDTERYYINNQKVGLEVYIAGATKKYVTITGNVLADVEYADRTAELQAVLDAFMVRPAKATPPAGRALDWNSATGVSALEWNALLDRARRAKNGSTFSALYDRGDVTSYKSASEADLALCNLLAFWTQRDASMMDKLFRQSGLMREKWDRPQSGSTYGAITIQAALDGCTTIYDPAEQTRPAGGPTVSASEWEPPIPFTTIDTPPFPIESLPGPVAAFVEALANSTQTPEEMSSLLSLGILATAFQGRYTVEVTPDWKEPLCLYIAAIAAPGERKSAVIHELAKPVYRFEADMRELEAVDVARNQTERRLLEKALANAEAGATKKKGGYELGKEEALALSEQLAQFVDKHPMRLVVDDTTPEKLAEIMDAQAGKITVASAEGGLFDTLKGRYDKPANFDVYLKGHAGDPILVDRIGRKSNRIPDPRLTMLLTIQPEVLSGLMSNTTFRGRGLCGRFLYAVCNSKVGRREVDPPPIPEQVRAEYRKFVRRILSGSDTGTLRLSPEARRIQLQFAERVESRLGGDLEHMRDWGGKLVGAMVRIAGLIHASESSTPSATPISGETITAAVKIAECLTVHAMAAYQTMGADETYEDAKYLLRRLGSTGRDEISKRDLWHICKGKYKRVDEMDPALQTLIEMGYIREVEKTTGGRPTKMLYLNPQTKSTRSTKSPR